MRDLTKDFKSGKLEKNKHYYVKTNVDREFIKFYGHKGFKGIVKEVLSEVPSYEELKQLKELIKELEKKILEDELISLLKNVEGK